MSKGSTTWPHHLLLYFCLNTWKVTSTPGIYPNFHQAVSRRSVESDKNAKLFAFDVICALQRGDPRDVFLMRKYVPAGGSWHFWLPVKVTRWHTRSLYFCAAWDTAPCLQIQRACAPHWWFSFYTSLFSMYSTRISNDFNFKCWWAHATLFLNVQCTFHFTIRNDKTCSDKMLGFLSLFLLIF